MPDPLLPRALFDATIVALDGQSWRTFMKHVAPLCERDERGRIITASYERVRGRPVTVEEYLRAERQRDRKRQWQHQYRVAHQGA